MLHRLLYVSRAAPQGTAQGIDDLLAAARRRNAALDVTGVLIFTGGNFAQLLEGPGDALDQVMDSIGRDPRHSEVRTLLRQEGVPRTFEDWDMAYEGSSAFIARHVRVLTASFAAPNPQHVPRLMALMASLAGPQ